jgi:L-aspartate oxidase
MRYCQNDMSLPLEIRQLDANHTNSAAVIVVGSGLAGLLFALRAVEHTPVVLVTKAEIGAGSSAYAQGGIAAVLDPTDSITAHMADTITAGAGLCEWEAVRRACVEGPAVIAELVRWGVAFDRDGERLSLGREGAHSANRIAHAGGDATGAAIVAALRAAVTHHPGITLQSGQVARHLEVAEGRVTGLVTEDARGCRTRHAARAVVMATGGAGELFFRTTNPRGATGDGVALAALAGAAVADLEFTQFHPTALALGPSPLALVSEAARGAGGYLRDARGHRFMLDIHPQAELGPRDVVARAVARQARADGQDVVLDMSHLDADDVRRHFPNVAAGCARHGLDLATDLIPVTPAAHYAIGGVLTDMTGRSTLLGLYALGECAATGLHGANRLASNSLLEAAVMAVAAADDLAAGGVGWRAADPAPTRTGLIQGATPADIGAVMWSGMGLERDAAGMAETARALEAISAPGSAEARNLIVVARLSVRAAQARSESRGAHYRSDFPATHRDLARRVAWLGDTPYPLDAVARRRATRTKETA